MGLLKGVVTQGGADTLTQGVINTDLTVDGKSAWFIKRFVAYWSNGNTAAAADMELEAILSTQATTGTTFNQTEEIGRIEWAISNTAGVAVTYVVDPIKEAVFLPADRLTVQPQLYVTIKSTTTGLTNVVYYAIEYDIVKLSDNELLRLAVGGA